MIEKMNNLSQDPEVTRIRQLRKNILDAVEAKEGYDARMEVYEEINDFMRALKQKLGAEVVNRVAAYNAIIGSSLMVEDKIDLEGEDSIAVYLASIAAKKGISES